MHGLRVALGVPVGPVDQLGWNGDALEAQCFAFLAVRSLRGLPLSAPTVTGAACPVRWPPDLRGAYACAIMDMESW